MAVRSASRTYPTLVSFLEDWRNTLRIGALTLPPGSVDGDPSSDMQVDLVIPHVGRLGPTRVQLLQVTPDGTTVVRVPEWPAPVMTGIQQALDEAESVKQWFIRIGEARPPADAEAGEMESLRRKIKELESRPPQIIRVAAPAQPGAAAGPSVAHDAEGNVVVERGLPLPDLRGMSPALSGQMGDRSLRDAMMELALERITGLLTVEYPDGRTRWGYWSKGGPVAWRADPIVEDEVLGILMFRANQLTRPQLEESLDLMEKNGVRQGEALIEMGVITFAQLVQLLQKQAEFVFQRLLRDREGSWTFHVLEELPERFVSPPLRVPSLLFRALRTHVKDMAAEELATTLRPWLDQYVYWVDGAQRVLSEMKINTDEAGFFKIVGATSYRLRELFSVSNLSRSATAGMIWTLNDLHLIRFDNQEAGSRGDERLQRVLDDRRRAVIKGSLFEALDLHWICTTADVEAAWRKMQAEYGPTSHARWGAANKKTVEEIYAKLEAAYERLRSDTRRREYRLEVMEKMQIEQSAEMLAKKGEMAFVKDNAREALDCFEKACELMPNIGEFQSGLAKARAAR